MLDACCLGTQGLQHPTPCSVTVICHVSVDTRRYQHPLQQAHKRGDPSLRIFRSVLHRCVDLRGHRLPGRVNPALRTRQVT